MTPPILQRRFRDDGRSLFSFTDEILVCCPKCGATGWVVPVVTAPTQPKVPSFTPRQFCCSRCHHREQNRGTTLAFVADARDPYLRLPLLLQTRTRHGILFAYNERHLSWIEAFISARLRERRLNEGASSRSVAARLPLWVKQAGNRAEMLRAIVRLRCLVAPTKTD